MEILEKLRQFLLGFPGFDRELPVDFTQDGPGNSGLFPGGLTEVDRYVDLLGNMQVWYQSLFTLYHRMQPGQDSAQWLLDFENWLTEQGQSVQIKKAEAQEVSRLNSGLCTVTLAVHFRKDIDAKEGSCENNGFVYH
ncbi:MAG: hypothetical protein IKY18_07920 [Oscillospiraceae bacterium]|nr:hypothetical protein [Oscillospiraceae bacterium]